MNVTLYPYTTDDVYLHAFREVVPRLLEAFQPDALVTQVGIDSHYRDPITHVALTVQGFAEVVAEFAKLSPSKWLALGGGGYDLHTVARAWTLAYGVMSEQDFGPEIPESYTTAYDVTALHDPADVGIQDQVRRDALAFADSSIQAVHKLIYPAHGLRAV